MPKAVKTFKDFCAELGEPSISLFVAKLAKPTFSWGMRRKIIVIKKMLIIKRNNFNMIYYDLIINFKNFLKDFAYFISGINRF